MSCGTTSEASPEEPTVAVSEDTDPRRARIWTLAQSLKAHGYAVELAESEPVLAVVGSRPVLIRCDRRASDDAELWLFNGTTLDPITQADATHLQEAITWVKRRDGART
jgi:hypothetical protein